MTTAAYTCPTCGTRMERDILLFYKHTDQHIVDEIHKKNPGWVSENGFCQKCLDFFKTTMGKGAAAKGESALVNIGVGGARARTMLGAASLTVAVTALILMNRGGAPKSARAVLFFPLFVGLLGLFQAQRRVCVVIAAQGNADPVLQRALRIASAKIIAGSAFFAFFFTLLLCIL